MDWITPFYLQSLEQNRDSIQEQKESAMTSDCFRSERASTPVQVLKFERTLDAQSSIYCSFGDNAAIMEVRGLLRSTTDQQES